MPKILADLLMMPKAALLILAACIGAFILVLALQYGFGVQPCVLCIWQRVPVGTAAILALAAYVMHRGGKPVWWLLALCAVVFAVESGLAIFHTGVERHWWLGTSGCTIQHPLHGNNAEDLRQQLLNTVVARCDEISWTFLGLSLANWNVPFSLALCAFSALAARRTCKFRT